MSSNDKIKVKAIENSCFLLGMCFLFAALLLTLGYHFFEYKTNEILLNYISAYVCSAIILLYMAYVSVKQFKFYYIFVFVIFLLFLVRIFQYIINGNLENIVKIILDTSVLASATILIINNLITRVFFREGDNKNSQDVDAVSSEFAVDVISVSLFFGIIFGTIAYLFFVPNKDIALFFGGIDIKNIALATAGLVTFFWGAKAAKNKSIELDMLQRRDTAQLIAKASELLGSENDAQKNAGLSFLNTVASQTGGPLQKEAFDLLADFILSDADIKTSNKPRMRAIIYVDDLLEESCAQFGINDVIVISASDGAESNDAINDLNSLQIKNLYVTYVRLTFFSEFIRRVTNSKIQYQFGFVNCILDGARFNEPPEIIGNIKAIKCHIQNCKVADISTELLVSKRNFPKGSHSVDSITLIKPESKMKNFANRFSQCDFSDFIGWENISSHVKAGKEKEIFDKCFYYPRHAPHGFNKDDNRALLTEITSEQQFYELIDDSRYMMYSPPDDEKTSNE